MNYFLSLDRELFQVINAHHNYFFDDAMVLLSSKGFAIPLYLMLVYLVYKQYNLHVFKILIAVALMILVSDQVSVSVKNLVERLRPCHQPELSALVHLVQGKCGGMFGFYSSHASNTAALVFFIFSVLSKRKWMPVLFIWCFLVGYSRIYLGNHFPLDVMIGWLAGALIGSTFAILVKRFLPPTNLSQ